MALATPAPELHLPPTRISEAEMHLYYQLLRAAARAEAAAAAAKWKYILAQRREPCRKADTQDSVVSYAFSALYPPGANNQRKSDSKFILILDRRLDTWTSVKMTLQRVAASFPGNLHLVMVLRPTGFFQRTFTDIGFRFSQEDFLLKLPVVMLSSVSDLLMYIDEKQLTPEYGGSLEYCHREWVIFRTAIESFALTVKEIAQMLQSFGMELAETELPDDTYSIERILALRTEKYYQLKASHGSIVPWSPGSLWLSGGILPSAALAALLNVRFPEEDITTVTKEGNMLLSGLEEPEAEEPSEEHAQERSADWETVNRLLAQLHEMEAAFDGFWEKHQLKMEQYLQLWRFEQHFEELSKAIAFLLDQQRELPDTADNVSQVKQRLLELDNLDKMSQDLTGKAQVVILHGHQLAANHHYALNLICQQCNELRHHSDILLEEIKRKRNRLQKTLALLTSLQQALECCDEGAYLLANQPMDKCQSREGAQKALQDIEKFLESSSLHLNADPQDLYSVFELILTPELKARIQTVQVKLENVRSMFENRQACFRKLADKQVRPVQLVAPRPENPPRSKSPLFSPKHGVDFNSSLKFSFDISLPGKKTSRKSQSSRKIEVIHDYQEKRNSLQYFISESEDSLDILKSHVINELIETERVYVEELFTVLMGYRAEMDNPTMAFLLPPMLQNHKDVLFGNMPEIYDFHNKIFLHLLESCLEAPERVGYCFLERECQRKLEHKLGLDSYLLKPVQRLTKYQLLLKELLKYSTSCEGVQELQEALVAMLDLLKSVNDSMHQISITGYDGDIGELGKVLMQGSFSVWTGHHKGPTKMKDLARFKPMQRHLFLYEKALVFCKKREDHSDSHEKTSSYSFKHFLKMNAVGITENVKGDHRKFEIWYSGREEVYVVQEHFSQSSLLQAQTVDLKMAWLNEIRKILFKQQELIKVEKQPPPSCADQIQLSPPLSNGKNPRASVSSEENDSEHTSPVALDSIASSPQSTVSRPWPGMSHSLEICEGLGEWSSHNCFSTCSDTEEEEEGSQLSPRRYKVLADCKKRDSDDLLVKNGDVIQLLHEDGEGQWQCERGAGDATAGLLRGFQPVEQASGSHEEEEAEEQETLMRKVVRRLVKNLNRRREGWVAGNSLQLILGDCRFRNARVAGIL
ncbi:Proto-oncogene DBL [Varanus komodoensis]|nr:Proto-oncogene DBL [Varanus komodoensis]